MKYYDFSKAKKIIESQKDTIETASLGFHEDWFWTAQEIYSDGEYQFNLIETNEAVELNKGYEKLKNKHISMFDYRIKKYHCILVGGCFGSKWATPALNIVFKSGLEAMIKCYIGSNDVPDSHKEILSEMWAGGCLSSPVQQNIVPLFDF